MKHLFTRYIAFLSVVGVGLMTSCEKTNSTGTVPTEVDSLKVGLIAYYPFNDSGIDESGNGNHGFVYNITSTSDRNGKANAAYYFDGLTSYISVKDNQALRLNNTDFTINTWVKIDAYNVSSGSFVISKRTMGTADGWGSSVTGYSAQNVGIAGLAFFGPGGTDPFGVSNKVLAVNTWYMVTTVYTLSKQQVSFYINGVFDKSTTGIASPNAAITADMYIGRDNPASSSNGYYFKGSMDDMRIYGRALTSAQIQKLYTLTY